jgi:amino acid permease
MRLKREHFGWLAWIVLVGILCWLGREHYHLKHTGTFMIILTILVVLVVVSFALLERKAR